MSKQHIVSPSARSCGEVRSLERFLKREGLSSEQVQEVIMLLAQTNEGWSAACHYSDGSTRVKMGESIYATMKALA